MGLRKVVYRTQYRTGDDDLVDEFYIPSLDHAQIYERAVGYFRSSIYLMVGPPTVAFARRGGRLRLLCSPSLSSEDIESIQSGYQLRSKAAEKVLLDEIESLLTNSETEYRTRVLATLIAADALEVKIAIRRSASGIFHEKIGIFTDVFGDSVSFLGSANETWHGWSYQGNHEAIEVFCSWRDGSESERVVRHKQYLDRLWSGRVPGIDVLDFPTAARQKLVSKSLGRLDHIDLSNITSDSKKRRPMPHQERAIKAWTVRGKRGVFEHATGSGKTFLALTAMRPHLSAGLPVLILVPSSLLLKQWAQEVREEFPSAAIMLCGAGNSRWSEGQRLRSMTAPAPQADQRVVISTMQTAATDGFVSGVFPGSHLMIVADEVHQIGSEFNSRCMKIDTGSRIGLSATPTRYGDPEGTQRIVSYFGDTVPPPFTLYDAIRAGRLVNYEYFPHVTHLTAEEADEWKALTKKISAEVARAPEDGAGRRQFSDRAKMLAIQRSRIAKKAANKVQAALDLIKGNYSEGQRWLVYCEDLDQMSDVLEALRNVGLQATEYHSAMAGDAAATLDWFRVSGGVLVSIRCLDEGVDIPVADHALILASSQNPRQFIQRRGRVLRKAPDKYLARIYDAVVFPVSVEGEPEQLSLLKAEFQRAVEFASHALNKSAGAELRALALNLGLDVEGRSEGGIEEEEG